MPSASVEEYLEIIYKLQQEEHPVRASKLAKQLDVSAASVTEMIKKLSENGYVNRTSDLGICLTQKGEKAALKLIRKHRLIERFLTDVLGISWDKVHDEACQLEHVISSQVEDRFEKILDSPKTCPHGYPIPSKDGKIAKENVKPLSDLPVGKRGLIVKVFEEDPKMLQYLSTLGLIPEVEVFVKEIGVFGGPLLVEVGRAKYALGREVASKILIRERNN
ncbi:MAG: metal-dependent transcriptional regulator [Actinobacteria bacterium]|nr:metal-dependent transcriptional regulator [Actinomycetota bacterium]